MEILEHHIYIARTVALVRLEKFSLGRRFWGAGAMGCILRMGKGAIDGVRGRGADLNYASERIGQDRRNQRSTPFLAIIDKGHECT